MTTCVYALVSPARRRLRVTGMAGEPLRVMTVSRVSAVIGGMRRVPAPSIRNLRRYAAVVEAIAAEAPAILPARFATTVADREELAFILASRGATLRRRLRAVRGRCQMTIRLLSPLSESESESDDAPLASRSAIAGRARLRLAPEATQGTQYLQRRAALAASARAIPGFAPIRAAVRRFVKDERVEKRAGIVTVNHLIPRAAAPRYLAAVEQAATANHLRLMVSGPLAPYAFADNW
ncbi:MAG TPA: GvpL/GvpF family gas vesicle protein [Vicinamibacterales bacterium]|nr:GvpL/GvpF family gas vesicle protein [Vicinamibacterales bacterium]